MKKINWKWQETAAVAAGLLTLAYALMNYSRLPDKLPSHFGWNGEVNGYMDKAAVIAMTGLLGPLLPLLIRFTRRLDPKRDNYKRFEGAQGAIVLTISLFFDLMLLGTVRYGLGSTWIGGKLATAFAGVLLIIVGNYMPQIRDNYFLGIRTPWTLASPEVWRRTHRLGGLMWVAGGLLVIAGALTRGPVSPVLLASGLVLAILVPVVYSWLLHRRLRS
ncbi:DUF1648 domain-containing protein [Paenibacillus spiritus]|uniref:DUF1648 domain-containing protein n=1 Tax=Paenibacillus spiritus TaxID=2496557 RepID=A0A5J5G5J5_9BACL|nr:SdpI family protein [Paenibacillus spiritus]KAA9002125.1 DUF1648 domain-containing protein [Paenibacillus spiritus]